MQLKNIREIVFGPKRILYLIIILGVIIRIVLMPISAHLDLFLASHREYLLSFHGIAVLNDMTELILSGYMFLMKPFLPHLNLLFSILNNQGTVDLPQFEIYSNFSRILRYIFILKIPYLLIDLVLLYFIYNRFASNYRDKLIVFLFWAFNPVFLYAVYGVGRYEIFPIFFLAWAIYLTKNRRDILAMMVIGLAAMMRMPFVLFLPFFVIYFSKNWKDYIKFTIIGFLPILLTTQLIALVAQQNLFFDTIETGFTDFFIRPSVGEGFNTLAPFFIAFPFVLYLFYREGLFIKTFDRFVEYLGIGGLVFYLTVYFHPQYFAWISPIIILIAIRKKLTVYLFIFAFLVFFAITDIYYNTIASTLMLSPLSNDFVKTLGGLRNQEIFFNFSLQTLLVILHSLFLVTLLITVIVIYKKKDQDERL